MALDVLQKMITDLNAIKAKLTGQYYSKCLELLNDLKDDLMIFRQDAHEIQTEEATMISGHIY